MRVSPVIALDIGGTHSRAALIDDGRIGWRAAVPTPGLAGPDAVIDALLQLLAPLRTPPAVPVGVAIAGLVVDDDRVTMHNGAVFRGWTGFPLARALRERLDRPVTVINDARAAAWGEHRFGAGRGCREFLFVTVSTGVGAGLVLDGRLHRAGNGFDAELGETLADGGRTTLEDIASGTALTRRALALGFGSAAALCDAAEAGDVRADAAWREGTTALALKLADLAVLLGVRRCAIGGGLGLRSGTLARLQQALDALPPMYRMQLVPAELGADAGLQGAADWALR
ncbi:ROK family protein [Aquincola sp. S2]|uniref:ROK family protein n=1 Tax=Pseudaquabacterium terrae TaxID=2732868 RepID=A0ABX2ESS0_9BURK|nr:ROK family protein [Aquabacterium terrae]